jgi:predicted nucleic acid-binding protein
METLALDTAALIALSRGDQRVRALLLAAANNDVATIVPAPVLAETLRGTRQDAKVHWVLNSRPHAIEVVGLDGRTARAAGEILGRTGLADATVDALIVAIAIEVGARTIVTGDVRDISRLLEGKAQVIPV